MEASPRKRGVTNMATEFINVWGATWVDPAHVVAVSTEFVSELNEDITDVKETLPLVPQVSILLDTAEKLTNTFPPDFNAEGYTEALIRRFFGLVPTSEAGAAVPAAQRIARDHITPPGRDDG